MNLELVTTIFCAQQQQQLELVLQLLWVCDHSTGLHGSSSSYSYSFAIIRNAAGRWMKAAGFLHSFLHSFLPEIHVTCHKLGSNPGKKQNPKPKTTISSSSSSSSSSSKLQSLH